MARFQGILRVLMGGLAAASLVACSGGSGSGSGGTPTSTGTVSFAMTDAPACGGQYESVFVTVTGLAVTGNDGQTHSVAFPTAPTPIDLLTLTGTKSAGLGDPIALPAGTYNQTRLILAPNEPGKAPANYVITAAGAEVPLTTPSAQQSGFKIIGPFTVDAGNTVDVVVDFNACRSIVSAGASGKLLLKPVLHAISQATAGDITGALGVNGAGAVVHAEDATGLIYRTTMADVNGNFTLSPLLATGSGAGYNIVVAPPQPLAPSTMPQPSLVPDVVLDVPVTAGQGTIVSTAAAPMPVRPPSAYETYSGNINLATADADTLVLAQQTVSNGAGASSIISFAQTNGVPGAASNSASYSVTFPVDAPYVGTYSPGVTPAFSQAQVLPAITVAAFGSDGSTGTAASPAAPDITMSGSGNTTYQDSN